MRKIGILIGLLLATLPAFAQTTSDAVVAAALQNHPLIKAADFEVQAKKYAEKAGRNLPNPEVNAESPTGEFYTFGVSQAFEFPTVYVRQKQVAQAETALAQAGRQLSENDLRYTVRSLYLDAQVAAYQFRQWTERDSLYQLIMAAATRQFAAGEIDFLQKTLAENEAGNVRLNKEAAEVQAAELRMQLIILAGLTPPLRLSPLAPDTAAFMPMMATDGNPAVAYALQAGQVAAQQIRLAKSHAWPDFSLGYMNQGPRNTPLAYRFRAGIGIPLWTGQYRAGIQSARAESQAATARAEAESLAATLDLEGLRIEAAVARYKLHYFEREALPRSQTLITAALRLREAGQTDYVSFLRTLDEAFAIPRNYAAQVQAFEAARIRMLYLAGR